MGNAKEKYAAILWIELGLLVALTALVYLPGLTRATIYRDDWYYTVDRLKGGPGTFQEMFSIDRPARGPFFELYYQLFGYQPLPYHISSYFWRLLSGLGALWLFRLIWPKDRRLTLFMAIFFTLYPGYLKWMEGFEDQPQMVSLCLEVFSIALTIKAIQSAHRLPTIGWWLGAILTGWAYLALVDFAIGMEFFRLLCVAAVVLRKMATGSLRTKAISILRSWAPAIVIPAAFLAWRLFIFHSERLATDLGTQLNTFVSSPLLRGSWWLVRWFQSTVNTAFLAWVAPLFDQLSGLRLTEIAIGLITVSAAVIIIILVHVLLNHMGVPGENPLPASQDGAFWQKEAILVGSIGVVAGLSAVIITNRYVIFGAYSHYALPASLASAALLVGLLFYINNQRIRLAVICILVGFAVITHYVRAEQVLNEELATRTFWQQVAWRAPGIRAGTTLLVNYPGVSYGEDIDAAQGPANFIYFPEATGKLPVYYPLSALDQIHYTTIDILSGGTKVDTTRSHQRTDNFDNILVISQPTVASCVHIIDGQVPLLSADDRDQVIIAASKSKIENVITEGESPRLNVSIFGPEPAHTWCYYFEKATLALQQGDWQKVADLGHEAMSLSFHPNDAVEWVPFLQAYAIFGDVESFTGIASRIAAYKYERLQGCDILNQMQKSGDQFSSDILMQVDALLCYDHP